MNNKKTIFFVSALVLILGCYLLDLSYSLFVQTEEKDIVESVVPIISSTISVPSITLNPNEEIVIKQTIINNGTVDFNYSLDQESENITIRLLDVDDNVLEGTIVSSQKKDIYLYLKNETDNINTINFKLNTKYITLHNDLKTNIESEEKYVLYKTVIPYSLEESTLNYSIIKDNIGEDKVDDALVSIDDLNILTISDNVIILPLYNDNYVTKLDNYNNVDKGLFKELDKYGYTYYYRGNVDNNYLEINNELWRIIRINGNNTIRIIKDEKINVENDDYKKIEVNSEIEKWYINNKDLYDKYTVTDYFCINELDSINIIPTLNCNSVKEYDVYMIDANEILLAGANNGYLNDNIYSSTLVNKSIINLKKDTGLVVIDDDIYNIKPVINIKNTNVSGGNGTKSNPYKITVN